MPTCDYCQRDCDAFSHRQWHRLTAPERKKLESGFHLRQNDEGAPAWPGIEDIARQQHRDDIQLAGHLINQMFAALDWKDVLKAARSSVAGEFMNRLTDRLPQEESLLYLSQIIEGLGEAVK